MSFLQRMGFGHNNPKPKLSSKAFLPYSQPNYSNGALGHLSFADDVAIGNIARIAYMQNPIAHRAVRMIAETAASIQLQLFKDEAEINRHDILDLLKRPNFSQGGREFLEACYCNLMIDGNCYIQQNMNQDALPNGLYNLRPDRMRLNVDEQGWPAYYEYKIGTKTIKFNQQVDHVKPICHQTFFNPNDDHYGQSPFKAARLAIEIHNAASIWNNALLKNSARPSGAVVYKGIEGQGHLSDEQFTRLKQELEQTYQGQNNAGRPMILEGGLDWSAMGLSPKDMDFIEAKNVAAREIALALGVPPMLLGIPGDNKFANYQEANKSFLRQSILPMVSKFMANISTWLNPAWDDRLEIHLDLDKIEGLNIERESLWKRIDEADFLTMDEKRAAVGYPPLGDYPSLGGYPPLGGD